MHKDLPSRSSSYLSCTQSLCVVLSAMGVIRFTQGFSQVQVNTVLGIGLFRTGRGEMLARNQTR